MENKLSCKVEQKNQQTALERSLSKDEERHSAYWENGAAAVCGLDDGPNQRGQLQPDAGQDPEGASWSETADCPAAPRTGWRDPGGKRCLSVDGGNRVGCPMISEIYWLTNPYFPSVLLKI